MSRLINEFHNNNFNYNILETKFTIEEINYVNKRGDNPIKWAFFKGNEKMIDFILNHPEFDRNGLNQIDENGHSILTEIIVCNKVESLKLIIKKYQFILPSFNGMESIFYKYYFNISYTIINIIYRYYNKDINYGDAYLMNCFYHESPKLFYNHKHLINTYVFYYEKHKNSIFKHAMDINDKKMLKYIMKYHFNFDSIINDIDILTEQPFILKKVLLHKDFNICMIPEHLIIKNKDNPKILYMLRVYPHYETLKKYFCNDLVNYISKFL